MQPNLGVFVENRLRAVCAFASDKIKVHVVAPVPWFPFSSDMFGSYALYNRIPKHEMRHNIKVDHPRYPVIPKIGEWLQPDTYAFFVIRYLEKLFEEQGKYDLIDAHFFYPDGVAAAKIAKYFDIPLTITARGSDISDYTTRSVARERIVQAGNASQQNAAVCAALKDAMVNTGMTASKIRILRNGIDLKKFRVISSIEKPDQYIHVVSVGALVPRKGHHLTIEAIAELPNVHLSIAGAGPERTHLVRLIEKLGLQKRVTLLGPIPHDQLPALYNSAHLSVLSSDREGWANVLLESMACGTPVAATAIWGTPEVIKNRSAGVLIQTRSVQEIRRGIQELACHLPDTTETRLYAEQFSWDDTAQGIIKMFEKAVVLHRQKDKL